jgi:hypothetical protein
MLSRVTVQDRFHLGALVWHKDVLTFERLRMIESWLYSFCSLTIVFFAGDDEWYLKRLSGSKKEELFGIDALQRANLLYKYMVRGEHPLKPHIDITWDISEKGFPSDSTLISWTEQWFEMLRRE